MIGVFEIVQFIGENDAAGAKAQVRAKMHPDNGHECFLYLPPYLRKTQCGIDTGSRVFGVVDDVTGIGFAIFGEGSADFGYYFDADLQIKKKVVIDGETTIRGAASVGADLTVSGNVTGADCRISITPQEDPSLPAVVTSLATHTHTCSAPGSPTSAPIPTPIPG